jgi:hypothetical protein
VAMAALGVPLGPRTPETLIEEVECLPGVVRELELSTARRAVHRVIAMFELHYQGLDCMALSGSWAQALLMSSAMSWRRTALLSPARWPTPP